MLQSMEMPPQLISEPGSVFMEVKDRWRAIGLSTEPANRQLAEAAIQKIYRSARFDPPKKIVWCGSPVSQGLARSIVLDPELLKVAISSIWEHAGNSTKTNFRDSIRDSFLGSVRLFDSGAVKQELVAAVKARIRTVMTASIRANLKENLRASLSDSVWQDVWEAVWNGIWAPLWAGIEKGIKNSMESGKKVALDEAIRSSLKEHIGPAIKASVQDEPMEAAWGKIRNTIDCKIRVLAWDELWGPLQIGIWEKVAFTIGACIKQISPDSPAASGYGQHDAYWLAFYDYFRTQENLLEETDGVSGLRDLAGTAGWFLPHEHICWVCERPLDLSLDQDGALHAVEEPVVTYRDGWRLYGTHGSLRFSLNG